MTHDLERICPKQIFGAVVWLCTCGHRSWTEAQHCQHLEETR